MKPNQLKYFIVLSTICIISTSISAQSIQNNYLKAGKNGGYASAEFIGILKSTSPNYQTGNLTVELYPNPASDNITIQFEELSEDATIKLKSIDGKFNQSFLVEENSNTFAIDVSLLSAGMYIINFTTASGNTELKNFIKQ